MEPGAPPILRPAFASPRPENPLRLLIPPAILTAFSALLVLLAWAADALDLFWTGVFWLAFLWGGVILYFAGHWFEPRLRGVRA